MASSLPGGLSRLQPLLLMLVVALTSTCEAATSGKDQPNIMYILIDDGGWADFQSHDPTMKTPNIKKLRTEGLFLNQSYFHPMCAPSRSALLSGRYPHTWGAQVPSVMISGSTFYPKEKLEYLGDVMKKQGYVTHALGKWHQGLCHPSLTPLGRGFDTFYGMLCGVSKSHFFHFRKTDAYDWWDNDKADLSANGTYSTTLLTRRMVRIIRRSSTDKPFFAYLAYQAAHGPWEVDDRYHKYCNKVEDAARRLHCQIMYAVDRGVGRIVKALKQKEIYNNTVIIVTSDNGGVGPTYGGYNYPLRAKKGSTHEGGVRVYTVLKAPGLARTNTIWPGLIHAVDWMPTMVGMAGGEKEDWMHGYNLWPDIKALNEDSARKELLIHYDERNDTKLFRKAYRFGPWKLMQGHSGNSPILYPLPGSTITPEILPKKSYGPDDYQLYNLAEDPSEKVDLSLTNPDMLETMKKKMEQFLEIYKLEPFVQPTHGKFRNSTTGILNTCFCHPPWADDTEACPSP